MGLHRPQVIFQTSAASVASSLALNLNDLCLLCMTKEVIEFRKVPVVEGEGRAEPSSSGPTKPQDQIRVCEAPLSALKFRVQCAKVRLGFQRDKLLPNPGGVPAAGTLCSRPLPAGLGLGEGRPRTSGVPSLERGAEGDAFLARTF